MMDMEYAAYLATKHQCRCIGPQMDEKGNIACFLFNDTSGSFKTTFGARTESEFIDRLASLRRAAAWGGLSLHSQY